MTIAARGARHADPLPTPEAAAAAAIVYTSGSTGTPKGAVLSHGAIASAGAAIGAAQGVRPGERVWSHFPFFFSGGLCNFTMGSLLSGAGMVLAPRFDVAEAVAAIEQYRCSVVHAWPNIARRLIDQAGDRPERLASLRTGTWPLDLWFPDTALGHVRGINLYGMTETCTIFTSTTVEDGDAVRAETHGRPFEGCEVKVVDDAGRRLPTGEEGALRLRGFNVMSGYHDTPAGTGFDEDGFLITSDAGILQDDGYLRWTGRLDDMIRTSGIQVSPIEVEQVLEGLPGITKAGVTGVPHERRGEAVVAFITVGPAAEVDEEIALQWCRERLAGYKVPTSITVLPESELPLLGSGKLDRKTLKATAQPGI
jgi:acyl-CoA synthetase (AMP-forming)/AMP-acid ligase II